MAASSRSGDAAAPEAASEFLCCDRGYAFFARRRRPSGPDLVCACRKARRNFAAVPLPPVIFEDDSLVAFDKPSGLLVAPDRWDKQRENLMALVHAHPRYGRTVANVHRLDADTSGLLLCAKTKPALDFLTGQFQSKTVRKAYHAFVIVLPPEQAMKVIAPIRDASGVLPAEFAVDLVLGADEANPGRMRVFKKRGGKECTTEFRTLERFGGARAWGRGAPTLQGSFAFVECRPLTGRTHQLRLHLAAAGAPILNDASYGTPDVTLRLSDLKRGYKGRDEEKPLLARLALHATKLTLTHPGTREPLTLRAPLPQEFDVALKYLRKFAAARGA
jgi:23S rRNA-/tRNA-specific pseudouridylate synthase